MEDRLLSLPVSVSIVSNRNHKEQQFHDDKGQQSGSGNCDDPGERDVDHLFDRDACAAVDSDRHD